MDWACNDHAVAVVDDRGREICRRTMEHSAAGLRELLEPVAIGTGVEEVAIERPDGLLVESLLEAGITVVVISPNQVKNLRGRYGSAGNKDDRFDAFVLADTLRTDRARLVPLGPRQRRDRSRCGGPVGPVRTWSLTGWPQPTSCEPTCTTSFLARLGCSPTWTQHDQPGFPGPFPIAKTARTG